MPEDGAASPAAGSLRLWRGALLVAAVGALACIALACITWAGSAAPAASSVAAGELHRLSADQAACLRFAVIIRRSEAEEVTLDLGRYQTLNPQAGRRLLEEIARLDELGPDFPTTDYRLIRSFANAADASSRVVARNGYATFTDAAATRSQAIAEAEAACQGLAGFDATRLRVR